MFPSLSKVISLVVVGGLLAVGTSAQQSAYADQCGGIGWTGATTCVAGYTCVYQNDWYEVFSMCPWDCNRHYDYYQNNYNQYDLKDNYNHKDDNEHCPGPDTNLLHGCLPVVNAAHGGTSSRSFTTLGYFQGMYNTVQSGDIVVIEFGHNDGGGHTGTSGRGVCDGDSLTTTCTDTDDGSTVYTFVKFLYDAVNTFKSRGCTVIVSSQTPSNPYDVGTAAPRFVGYAQTVASLTGAYYIDHFSHLLKYYTSIGETATTALFVTGDHTHTTATGAEI
ncbi:hypothetical protein FS837_008087, partial [Tulasnella sp. UAMH 9824]